MKFPLLLGLSGLLIASALCAQDRLPTEETVRYAKLCTEQIGGAYHQFARFCRSGMFCLDAPMDRCGGTSRGDERWDHSRRARLKRTN